MNAGSSNRKAIVFPKAVQDAVDAYREAGWARGAADAARTSKLLERIAYAVLLHAPKTARPR